MSAHLSKAEVSPMIEDYYILGPGHCYSDPEDYPEDSDTFGTRGPQTRLYWNLDDHPIPEGADLADICRKIKIALHRKGIHGFLHIWTYGKLSHNERDLLNADILHTPSPPPKGWSTSGQICVDILRLGHYWHHVTSSFVVIAKPYPELDRVLQCMRSRYRQTVLTIEPQYGLFRSADSVFQRTQFLGGDPRTKRPSYEPTNLVKDLETGVFWDAIDCPFPATWTVDSIFEAVKSAFTYSHGVSDNMSFWAYVDEKKESSLEFLGSKTWESRIDFQPAPDNPATRHERMLNDILMWSIHHPKEAYLIVAGQINKDMFHILGSLEERGYCVLIVRPRIVNDPESYDWPKSLMDNLYGFGVCESRSRSRSRSPSPKLKKKRKAKD